jgi:hypothetical protein
MRNCVFSFSDNIRKGSCYIYRLRYPERATVELMTDGDSYRIGQFELVGHGQPGTESHLLVQN